MNRITKHTLRRAADAVAAQPTATPPIAARAAVTERAAMSGDDLDTYGRVTIRTATLDGEDISGDLIEDDDNSPGLKRTSSTSWR